MLEVTLLLHRFLSILMCVLQKLYSAERVESSKAAVMCSCKCLKLRVHHMPGIVGIEGIAVSKVINAS